MSSLRGLTRSGMMCGIVAVLVWGLSPAIATAQTQVRGSGTNIYAHGAPDLGNSFQHIAVNAWLDDQGVAHGMMTWEGDIGQSLPGGITGNGLPGGPSQPFIIDVTDIFFVGNTAFVSGVVIASIKGQGNGSGAFFAFTDNSGTGEPDEIDGVPIDAGNITVDD
jgi:hypothetical protein